MKRHTSVDLDAELLDYVKARAGHGGINKICTEALCIFARRPAETGMLTSEERDRIAALRQAWEPDPNEEEILRECWDDIKIRASEALRERGPSIRLMRTLAGEAREWLKERQHKLPPGARIGAAFSKFVAEEPPGWVGVAVSRLRERRSIEQALADRQNPP